MARWWRALQSPHESTCSEWVDGWLGARQRSSQGRWLRPPSLGWSLPCRRSLTCPRARCPPPSASPSRSPSAWSPPWPQPTSSPERRSRCSSPRLHSRPCRAAARLSPPPLVRWRLTQKAEAKVLQFASGRSAVSEKLLVTLEMEIGMGANSQKIENLQNRSACLAPPEIHYCPIPSLAHLGGNKDYPMSVRFKQYKNHYSPSSRFPWYIPCYCLGHIACFINYSFSNRKQGPQGTWVCGFDLGGNMSAW